jgi:hypothetical protein
MADASTNPSFIGIVTNKPVLMSPRRTKKSNQEKQPQRSNLCQATIGVDQMYLLLEISKRYPDLTERNSLEKEKASKLFN